MALDLAKATPIRNQMSAVIIGRPAGDGDGIGVGSVDRCLFANIANAWDIIFHDASSY